MKTKVEVASVKPLGRKTREPQHQFLIEHQPFQLVPFAIAPVLPGETLKNALLQSRVSGPPVKSTVLGAWCEHYLFYVKLRDLAGWQGASGYRAMLMDASVTAGAGTAALADFYRFANSPNFVEEALTAVVDEFFRLEGETAASAKIGSYPLAAVNNASYLDSTIDATTVTAPGVGDYLPGDRPENTDLGLSPEYDAHYSAWFKMFSAGLTTLDFDDYLKSYGIAAPEIEREPEASKPELLRYMRDWKYPSNIVDGSGNVASSWQWEVTERADKARFFKEPGFLLGVTCVRPKVYLSKMAGAGVGMLANALQWLPAVLEGGGEFASLKQYAAGAGPLPGTTNGYWVDPRDLFIYGDQMLNVALTRTDVGLVALPTAAMQKRFVSQADIDGMMKTAGVNKVVQDGVLKLTIAGRVREITPST